jgi:hypothetical protein
MQPNPSRPTPASQTPPGDAPRPGPLSPRLPVPPAPRASSLHVDVGRLVLDGFDLPPGGERQVQAAFERELTHLLSSEALPDLLVSGGARRDLPGEVAISSWTGPEDLGRQIARSIARAMRAGMDR